MKSSLNNFLSHSDSELSYIKTARLMARLFHAIILHLICLTINHLSSILDTTDTNFLHPWPMVSFWALGRYTLLPYVCCKFLWSQMTYLVSLNLEPVTPTASLNLEPMTPKVYLNLEPVTPKAYLNVEPVKPNVHLNVEPVTPNTSLVARAFEFQKHF